MQKGSIAGMLLEQTRGFSSVSPQGINLQETTDDQLIKAAAEGNVDAFGEIILRHQHAVWKVAYRFLGDSMEAEDAAQEAFLKVLEAAPRYRPQASFRAYLYRVLTHICIDRSRKKRPATLTTVPDIPDPSPDPAQSLMAKELHLQIRNALEVLPTNQKAAIFLKHYEGLSYAEIAQVLDTTAKAVEGLIGRARATLQSQLAHLKKNQ
jgi:RNA polymerase sigma-70 factor, ECF subfamily